MYLYIYIFMYVCVYIYIYMIIDTCITLTCLFLKFPHVGSCREALVMIQSRIAANSSQMRGEIPQLK